MCPSDLRVLPVELFMYRGVGHTHHWRIPVRQEMSKLAQGWRRRKDRKTKQQAWRQWARTALQEAARPRRCERLPRRSGEGG